MEKIVNKKIRKTKSFKSRGYRKQYFTVFTLFLIMAIACSIGLIMYKNPVPAFSKSFWPIVERRSFALLAMLIAATCQSVATIVFQSLTNNKVITPSLLGFEALYSAINTGIMFFLGVTAFLAFTGTASFLIQIISMIAFSLLLYSWLLFGESKDLQFILLLGIVLSSALKSLSAFMRRVLSPSEYSILQTKLFASVNNADHRYFPISIILVVISLIFIWKMLPRLNVLALGRDMATNLGVNYKKNTVYILILVSILMAVSTALVGPLSFFGFLVASFTYQIVKSFDYKYVLPMAMVLSYLIITLAYFVMNHIFSAQGVVSILIEFVGGVVFLLMIFRKGNYDSN